MAATVPPQAAPPPPPPPPTPTPPAPTRGWLRPRARAPPRRPPVAAGVAVPRPCSPRAAVRRYRTGRARAAAAATAAPTPPRRRPPAGRGGAGAARRRPPREAWRGHGARAGAHGGPPRRRATAQTRRVDDQRHAHGQPDGVRRARRAVHPAHPPRGRPPPRGRTTAWVDRPPAPAPAQPRRRVPPAPKRRRAAAAASARVSAAARPAAAADAAGRPHAGEPLHRSAPAAGAGAGAVRRPASRRRGKHVGKRLGAGGERGGDRTKRWRPRAAGATAEAVWRRLAGATRPRRACAAAHRNEASPCDAAAPLSGGASALYTTRPPTTAADGALRRHDAGARPPGARGVDRRTARQHGHGVGVARTRPPRWTRLRNVAAPTAEPPHTARDAGNTARLAGILSTPSAAGGGSPPPPNPAAAAAAVAPTAARRQVARWRADARHDARRPRPGSTFAIGGAAERPPMVPRVVGGGGAGV
ncbi:hypothetical protein BU14_0180s0004 [Porphyra umbilicalis]|uniref:Uncharacterized protein n=1 Tax=Porphyra umbilicalis TaxID=2786 RepID=A0A1X6P753_PORUM|nr:hypothetical protein BU14_0180s0004 [Porphyra umbilicalis]|eukprot:OSX76657.1 hypothetical protein BU14_0180s0004 [Porphyra umbilicalis]